MATKQKNVLTAVPNGTVIFQAGGMGMLTNAYTEEKLPIITTSQSQEADRKILDDFTEAVIALYIAERHWQEIENEAKSNHIVIKGITREANGFWHRDLMEKRALVEALKRVVLKTSALPVTEDINPLSAAQCIPEPR